MKIKIFLILSILFFSLNKIVFSNDFQTAMEHYKNKDYIESYNAFNKCTSECLESGNCNKEHFLCMLEIGRMLEQGLAEENITKEERFKKAKFWYNYCKDKGSEVCAEKLSTLKPRNKFIVKSIQEKLVLLILKPRLLRWKKIDFPGSATVREPALKLREMRLMKRASRQC